MGIAAGVTIGADAILRRILHEKPADLTAHEISNLRENVRPQRGFERRVIGVRNDLGQFLGFAHGVAHKVVKIERSSTLFNGANYRHLDLRLRSPSGALEKSSMVKPVTCDDGKSVYINRHYIGTGSGDLGRERNQIGRECNKQAGRATATALPREWASGYLVHRRDPPARAICVLARRGVSDDLQHVDRIPARALFRSHVRAQLRPAPFCNVHVYRKLPTRPEPPRHCQRFPRSLLHLFTVERADRRPPERSYNCDECRRHRDL